MPENTLKEAPFPMECPPALLLSFVRLFHCEEEQI